MGFAIIGSLARHRRPQSVPCSSARILASRFFQASPLGEYDLNPCAVLTLHLHQVGRGLSPPSCRACSAHQKNEAESSPPRRIFVKRLWLPGSELVAQSELHHAGVGKQPTILSECCPLVEAIRN